MYGNFITFKLGGLFNNLSFINNLSFNISNSTP